MNPQMTGRSVPVIEVSASDVVCTPTTPVLGREELRMTTAFPKDGGEPFRALVAGGRLFAVEPAAFIGAALAAANELEEMSA